MLILSRKPGESIVVSGGIKIIVMQVRGQIVRVGIEAPPSVDIWREEIYERIDGDANGGNSNGRTKQG